MDVRFGLWRKLGTEELMLLNCGVESPLDCKEIQPVHSKGDQSWVFFGRNDAKAETPVLWPPHVKSCLTGKDSDAGRDWGQEEKGTTEDEMAGWHHWLDVHEFEWTLGVGDGQGGLVCCDSWGHKELDTTEWLNWTELNMLAYVIYYKIGNNKSNQIAILFRNTYHTHRSLIDGNTKAEDLRKHSVSHWEWQYLHGNFSYIRSLLLSGLGFYRAWFLSQMQDLIIKMLIEK